MIHIFLTIDAYCLDAYLVSYTEYFSEADLIAISVLFQDPIITCVDILFATYSSKGAM